MIAFEAQGNKPSRTRVACASCKRRKTKCNGEHPCSCCLQRGKECFYPTKERRKRGKGLNSSKEELGQLSKRLAALESVISSLGDKLSGLRILHSSEEARSLSPPSHDSHRKSFTSTSPLDGISKPTPASNEVTTVSTQGQDVKDEFCPLNFAKNVKRIHQYFGNHSIYAIFSKDSVSWLRKKLSNEPILIPFKNFPMVLDNMIKSSTSLWVNPPSKYNLDITGTTGNFPTNSGLVFDILEAYYDLLYFANTMCELQTVRGLFQIYYAHNTPSGQFSGSRHNFKASELILMNTALALCLANRLPEDKKTRMKYSNLSALTEKEFYDLKEMFFENAIALYHKISVVNEGITTVQCLLLMIFYVECTYASDFHIVYMLSSVLVRYAQELGLHRVETLNKLRPKEACLGKQLWLACEYIDTEICYKSGKPPLINSMDISTLGKEDPDIRSVPLTLFLDPQYAPAENLKEKLLYYAESQGIAMYHDYFGLFLNRIRRKSYMDLYSASAQNCSAQEVLAKVNDINETMFKVIDMMDPVFRPFKSDSPGIPQDSYRFFKYLNEIEHSTFLFYVLTVKLGYLSHMLIINSSPIFRGNLQHHEYEQNCKLSLRCARSILKVVTEIDKTKVTKSMVTCLSFYPLVALITLLSNCVSLPKNPHVDMDCRLIIEVSLQFFAYTNRELDDWEGTIKFELKLAVYDLMSRVFVGILVSFMRRCNGIDYATLIPGLCKHLKDSESIYPQLFKGDISQLDSFRSIFKNPFQRLEPKIANILDDPHQPQAPGSTDSDPISFGLDSWTDSNDNFSALLYSHMYNLPNMFFDAPDELFDLAYNDSH